MQNDTKPLTPITHEFKKALFLSLYFFLLICGYYFLKPLSRSLYVTYLGAKNLPYVWIATTLALSLIIPAFHLKTRHLRPSALILALILSLTILLIFFNIALSNPNIYAAFGFYILVDVYSVLIVENLWSLVNTNFIAKSGQRWYGMIAAAGSLGAIAAGSATSKMMKDYGLPATELTLFGAFLFLICLGLMLAMFRTKLIANELLNLDEDKKVSLKFKDIREFFKNDTYIKWIALLLLASQIIEPLAEYLFMFNVETMILGLDERTKFVSYIFSITSVFGLLVNLLILPVIFRYFGVKGGLLLQPVLIAASALTSTIWHNLTSISALKVVDRGLAYSSSRASKEILYIPLDSLLIYKTKAWIDVYGYRFFKLFGSFMLLAINFIPDSNTRAMIVLIEVMIVALLWIRVITKLKIS